MPSAQRIFWEDKWNNSKNSLVNMREISIFTSHKSFGTNICFISDDTKREVGKKAIWFVKSLLCGYIVTGFLLLILALMLYKLGLSEQNVNAGIVLIYVISTFSAGFVLGKLAGKRKFLWGLFAGITYFVLLMLITLGVYHAFQGNVTNIAVTFLLCAGGGMLGGMIA